MTNEDRVAYRIGIHHFTSIEMELHVFQVYNFAKNGNGEKKPRSLGFFCAIFSTSSKKYSDAPIATLRAGRAWLELLVKIKEYKEFDFEMKAINNTLYDEPMLFRKFSVRHPKIGEEQSDLDAMKKERDTSGPLLKGRTL